MKTTSAKRKSASSSSTRQTRSKTAAKIAVPKATARKTVGSNAPRKRLDDSAEDTQVPVCRGTRSATGSNNNTDRVRYTDLRTTLTQTTTDAQSLFTKDTKSRSSVASANSSHCTRSYKYVVITYDLTNRDQFDEDVAKQMR
ncbi:hypothetical protein EIP86_007207, partial [Pleurotus ostreatoroseus]